ncbi:hypothetical protein [Paenibacillus sp. MBLB4367]|uniref:hypothetical protein n=1 Tax=Paenibacillus sp. MBLB4367 TaxID=3384767 RepID=UPI0039082A2D
MKETVEIGTRVEMFVDDWLIEDMRGLSLKLHQPVKREVVLVLDKPWEGKFCCYFTVMQEKDRIRLYYRGNCFHDDDDTQVACYAESRDGVHFERPDLGLCEFGGSRANNIMLTGMDAHNFAPFLDANPDAPPQQKYKAVAGFGPKGQSVYLNQGYLIGYYSADGIHWRKWEEPIIRDGGFDSLNVAFWDKVRGEYRCYSRSFTADKIRVIQSATSADFLHWGGHEPNRYAENVPLEQFYTNATLPCPGAEHTYLSFPMRIDFERKKVREHLYDGVSDAVFMSSRDGRNWDRRFMEAWARPGGDIRNWTDRNSMTAWGIVETAPDEFSMYISEHYRWNDNRLRRLTVRKHGFASVNANYGGGEMVTRPLVFSGSRLLLNYATSAVGSIRVEVQDASGKPLEGFALEDMDDMFGDEISGEVNWNKGNRLEEVKGRVVRFRFVMKDADLYAMQTSD